MKFRFIVDNTLDLKTLHAVAQKPDLFESGLPLWTDPHICHQMLRLHLDPEQEAASRPPQIIDVQVEWIMEQAGLAAGDRLLDLGCGPGLYAQRFAWQGIAVTGIDISENSIAYARQQAEEADQPATYRVQNFLTIEEEAAYDAVIQVYGEISTYAPDVRDDLFRRVYRALKPDGVFVFDVSTPNHRAGAAVEKDWYIVPDAGFWKPGPHLVMECPYDYEDDIHLDQFVVMTGAGEISVYRTWFLDYTPETIRMVVEDAGFRVETLSGGLAGERLTEGSEWIGVVAVKERASDA